MEKTTRLSIEEMNPSIRFINLYQCDPAYNSGVRRLYDYYFLYVHSGKGQFFINDISYQLLSGDLLLCKPGDYNQIIADKDDPFLLTGINFDFINNYPKSNYPYPLNVAMFDSKYLTNQISFTDFSGFSPHMHFPEDESLRQLLLDMISIFEDKEKFWKVHVDGLLKVFISKVVKNCLLHDGEILSINKYKKILTYINHHYNEEISNEKVASIFHYHPDYINKIIYSYTGLTIKQYVIDLRIRKAVNLLMTSTMSIQEISVKVGYLNVNYFSKLFKKKTGFSPALFRNNISSL